MCKVLLYEKGKSNLIVALQVSYEWKKIIFSFSKACSLLLFFLTATIILFICNKCNNKPETRLQAQHNPRISSPNVQRNVILKLEQMTGLVVGAFYRFGTERGPFAVWKTKPISISDSRLDAFLPYLPRVGFRSCRAF